MRHTIRYLFILLLFVPVILQAQDEDQEDPITPTDTGLDVRILEAPIIGAERVNLKVAVFNSNGTIEGNLDSSNFTIAEQNQNFTVEPVAEQPIALAVVINVGLGVEIQLIQQTLRAYFNAYYTEGDEVVLYILDGQATSQNPRIVQSDSLDTIDRAIAQLTAPTNYLNITSTLNAALNQTIRWQNEDPNRAVQVLYVAPFLNRVNERDESFIFTASHIPFHVVQVHEARVDATDDMRALAINGNGIYANNQSGVLINDDGQAVGQLVTLYNAINEGRVIYNISYQPSIPTAGERNTTLNVTTPNGSTGSVGFAYEGLASPPVIELVSPQDLNMRFVERVSLQERIIIQVSFPDGIERDIVSLRVEIRDSNTQNILQSFIESNPTVREENSEIALSWEFGDYATAGTQTSIELVITITDELGYTASYRNTGVIAIIRATPTPTITPTPTLTPIPSSTPILNQQAAAVATGSAILLPLLCLIIILGFFVLRLSIRNINERRRYESQPRYMPQPTQEIILTEDTVEEEVEEIVEEAEEKIYARLFVMQGLDESEIIINREEFKIGRMAIKGCHYVIDEDIINPEHCTFIVRGKNILLKDLGSKNGTYVNGERLQPNREAIVPFGSEVQITRNISVQLNDPKTELSPSLRRATTRHDSQRDDGELHFKPMLQVRYIDDTDNLPDDYTPL